MEINSRWLHSIRFLVGAETELVVQVACSLQPAVFPPGELVTPGSLYVVHKGVSLFGGRLLTPGRSWGQDCILARQHLCQSYARAMSYLEVHRVSRAELLELARPFPIATRRIRWEALRLAMLRTLVATKRAVAEAGGSETHESYQTRVWQTFMEKASGESFQKRVWQIAVPPTGESFKISGVDEVVTDPTAVLEVPSLHDLSRGLSEVRTEVREMREGIDLILRAMSGSRDAVPRQDAHSHPDGREPVPPRHRSLFA